MVLYLVWYLMRLSFGWIKINGCKQHHKFPAEASIRAHTIWHRFDCNEYCLSCRFHLSHVIISSASIQISCNPIGCDEIAQMVVALWHRQQEVLLHYEAAYLTNNAQRSSFPRSCFRGNNREALCLRERAREFILPVSYSRRTALW